MSGQEKGGTKVTEGKVRRQYGARNSREGKQNSGEKEARKEKLLARIAGVGEHNTPSLTGSGRKQNDFRPGRWMGSVLSISYNALTLLVIKGIRPLYTSNT